MPRIEMSCTVALALTIAFNLAPSHAADRIAPRDDAVANLMADTAGTATVRFSRATGVARMVQLAPGTAHLKSSGSATDLALEFFNRYGGLFGVTAPERQLAEAGLFSDALRHTHLTFRQLHRGLPVFAGVLRVHLDADGGLVVVNGSFIPGLEGVHTEPRIEPAVAATAARLIVRKGTAATLTARTPRLLVYRTGLARGVPGTSHLAWEVEVGDGRAVRELVYVDALDGRLIDRIQGIHELHRTIHLSTMGNIVWDEGDSLPYSGSGAENDLAINDLIAISEGVYRMYSILSGGTHLSWNGNEAVMNNIHASTDLDCPNAAWNGEVAAFCSGMVTDDIVAHEWTHAYTDGTHDLIYQWQSGALNESFSDIFAEILDFINGTGTDEPDLMRSPGGCSTFGGQASPDLTVLSPAAVAADYAVGGAVFNPPPPWSIRAQVAYADDGIGSRRDACQALVDFPSGSIALIDRGSCNFTEKVQFALDAGASGVIVVNDQGDDILLMGGDVPAFTIPSVFLGRGDGDALKAVIEAGVEAELSLISSTDASVRWLVAEDSDGGALRDMWSPGCFGDPGKVSDPAYVCTDADSGGVHTNSGVPNHAFALVVDGGQYNGHSVGGIGATKAVHIYWRAMSAYQVPTTEFVDHADIIELSCADLIGASLADPLTGVPSGERIDAGDCAQLAQAMAAVEMRTPPSHCNFTPLLLPDPPTDIGRATLFSDTFDSALDATWTLSNVGVYNGYDPRDWVWTDDVPEGGAGGALFAVDGLFIGNCRRGFDDQSGVMHLDSPLIPLPAQAGTWTLAFDHYVATEAGFDGGNLKISVNGGSFELISEDAFKFNSYNMTLNTTGEGNTSPLAGEPAFSGSNFGGLMGSWGQSQVDLTPFASPGDTIQIRYDLGVDGCNGLDGWYLDNVRVTMNPAPRAPAARVSPSGGKSLAGTATAVEGQAALTDRGENPS